MVNVTDSDFEQVYEIDSREYHGEPITEAERERVKAMIERIRTEGGSVGVVLWYAFAAGKY